jgi:dolichol-phosphate mannosyltransferase
MGNVAPEVTVIVPCWNEESAIPPLLERLDRLIEQERWPWEVVCVDDGSHDRTPQLLDAASTTRPWLKVAQHSHNQGLGAALRTGLAQPLAPVVCSVDSDCTYPLERLPELIDVVNRGADVVTASPWHPENSQVEGSYLRVALSRTASGMYRWIAGTQIWTFTCLFRAYKREVISSLGFVEDGFAAVAEIMVKAVLEGYRIEEVPMPLVTRRHGESSMRITPAIAGHLRLLAAAAKWTRSHRRRERALRR